VTLNNKQSVTLAEIKAWHHSGRLLEAKSAYHHYLNQHPNDAKVWHLLSLLCAEENEYDEAIAYLNKAITIEPNNTIFQIFLSHLYKAKGELNKASQLLFNLTNTHPHLYAAFNNLGTIYYAQHHFQEAVMAFQSAIQIKSDFIDAYYNLGLTFNKLKRYIEASNAYSALIALSPNHLAAHFQLGCVLMQLQKYQEAISHFLLIEAKEPHHFETKTNLATCYLHLNKIDSAKTQYIRALELSSTDSQVLFNLGIISVQQGYYHEAIDYYLKSLQQSPNHFDAHNNIAIAYLVLKDQRAALRHFQEAHRLHPYDIAIKHTISILTKEENISSSPPQYVRALFDSYAPRYESHLNVSLQYQVPQSMYAAFQKVHSNQEQKIDILDLGCGTGLCGEYFKSNANLLVGVDISENMLSIARDKNIYDQLIEEEILVYLDQSHQQFDVILAADVVVYFGNLDVLFEKIKNRLRQNGIFIFNIEKNVEKAFLMTDSGRFAHSRDYLMQLYSHCQFEVLSCNEIAMRTQEGSDVIGDLYLLVASSLFEKKR